MQRLRQGLVLQLIKQANLAPVIAPLPGLRQLAVPSICAVTSTWPAADYRTATHTSITSLRSFAAAPELCRVEDEQSAAEALFRGSAGQPPTHYEPAVYPFFARAYYVGRLPVASVKLYVRVHYCLHI